MIDDLCVVTFVDYEPITTRKISKDRFEYTPSSGWRWLQRICFYILRKLNAYACDETVEYRRVTFSKEEFMREILRQKKRWMQRFVYEYAHGNNDLKILIGADDFEQIIKTDQMIRQSFSFTADVNYNRTILNMKFQVIPWMSGILLVPADEKQ